MISDLSIFTNKGCKIAGKKSLFWGKFCKDQEVIQQASGGHTTRIRRLYKKRIRRLYNKDQEVMFSNASIEPLQKTFAYKGNKITAQKKCFSFLLPILPY